jgi:hypothetical protein
LPVSRGGASRQISKTIFPEARRGGKSEGRFCSTPLFAGVTTLKECAFRAGRQMLSCRDMQNTSAFVEAKAEVFCI